MELRNGFELNDTLGSDAYLRFEPITVRAAVRVIRLQRQGVVSSIEADFYISELAAMDRHAGAKGAPAIARMARRQVSPQRIARPIAVAPMGARIGEQRQAIAAWKENDVSLPN